MIHQQVKTNITLYTNVTSQRLGVGRLSLLVIHVPTTGCWKKVPAHGKITFIC